jgi:hypothetical protein
MTPTFEPFPKMARLFRECIITEKIDGTNATVAIINTDGRPVPRAIHQWEDGNGCFTLMAGSRTRWITPEADNFGFAAWVRDNTQELINLGPGLHRGEWWGSGIQRNYGLDHRRFSLFNAIRWCEHDQEPGIASVSWDDKQRCMVEKMQERAPSCCHVVPVLYRGDFLTESAASELVSLSALGSAAAPGFMRPEGIVTYHIAANVGFKTTIDNDHEPKGKR